MARGVTGTWRTNKGSCPRVTMMLSFSTYLHLGTRFQFPNDRDDKWGNLGLKYWAPHESLICSQLGSSISTHSPTCITHGFYSFMCLCVWFMVVSLPLPPISWKPEHDDDENAENVSTELAPAADKRNIGIVKHFLAHCLQNVDVELMIHRFSQSCRRPLVGPSPGWKRIHILDLSHLRHHGK